jgi:cytoplasmic iron level regulating protein YaaA (DUF328/UPF0246 family)
MLILLSPAKSLNFEDKVTTASTTRPVFQKEIEQLVNVLKKYSPKKIGELMHLSAELSDVNYQRYQSFSKTVTSKNAKQALYAFTGEVYRGLDANTLSEKNIHFAQNHLLILSGLYGVLRPLDLMQPYRLEMGMKLKINAKTNNLYAFWGDKITDYINTAAQGKPIINLASAEYFKSVKSKQLQSECIVPTFKEYKNGQYKVVMMYAKNARGAMARYIIKKQLTSPEKLKLFNEDGYSFDEKQSSRNEWVFVR